MRFSRVSPDQDFQEKERERKVRRRIFHLIFAILALTLGGFLTWKLSCLVLPIIVGALLAFLFRPVKERFKIPWLPHELQVLCSFAAIGLVLSAPSALRATIFPTISQRGRTDASNVTEERFIILFRTESLPATGLHRCVPDE